MLTRRQLLQRATLLPAVVFAGSVLEGCADSGPVCADPELLSAAEAQMRRTLEYVDRAPDASKQCGGCRFFRLQDEGDCGHCQLLDGAVSRWGRCSSWTNRG